MVKSNLCSFCLFLMKTLEDLLPKQRTEAAVIHLLEDICHILPPLYQRQCQDVVGKFSKTIIDAILSYATPRSICELLHLCKAMSGDCCSSATSTLQVL
uniref:Saposin B-type domain-containing protein n=1 Tax=Periophthalmus magnuspinnatus TaxID=409849 RepID=A0A3B4A165_9GOBI